MKTSTYIFETYATNCKSYERCRNKLFPRSTPKIILLKIKKTIIVEVWVFFAYDNVCRTEDKEMERMTHVAGAMNGRYVSELQVWMRRVENMPYVLKWGGDLETARNYSLYQPR